MSEAVHRVRIPAVEVEGYPDLWNYSPQLDPERPAVEPGVWLSEPEDEAREAVVAAADPGAIVMGRPRSFDHDLANVMRHEGGLTLQELADQFGVTPQSIRYATDARVREYDRTFQREHTPWKAPCSDCGGPATARYREGTRCRECHLKAAASPHVRPDTLLCGFCQEWKHDEDFGRHAQASAARRGRRRECRACDSARRSGYRFRLPEDVRRDRDRRDYASRKAAS